MIIINLLDASLFLSAAVAALSLVNLGRLSVFIAPIAFLFTALHHTILRRRIALAGSLAPTAHKATIISLCLLVLLWLIVVMAVVFISVMVVSTNNYEAWERLAGYLEIPFQVAEISVLVVLTFKCLKQRRLQGVSVHKV